MRKIHIIQTTIELSSLFGTVEVKIIWSNVETQVDASFLILNINPRLKGESKLPFLGRTGTTDCTKKKTIAQREIAPCGCSNMLT